MLLMMIFTPMFGQKETSTNEKSITNYSKFSKYEGVTFKNGMLVFANRKTVEIVYNDLEKRINNWNKSGEETKLDNPYEDNLILQEFEKQFKGFKSLRRAELINEYNELERGNDPFKIEESWIVLDEIYGAFVNEKNEMQIGEEILWFKHENLTYVVKDGSIKTLNEIKNIKNPLRFKNVYSIFIDDYLELTCAANFGLNHDNNSLTAGFTFTGKPTFLLGADIGYFWTFGDGTTSTEKNPTHTYSQNGTYNVCVTIEVEKGEEFCTDQFCQDVEISSDCYGAALFVSNETGIPGELCFTDASMLYDIDSWTWNFGDGGSSIEQNPCHSFLCDAQYIVSLTVTTSSGCESTVSYPISIDSYECCEKRAKTSDSKTYNNGNNKIKYTLKNYHFLGWHSVVARMKNFKKKWNGGWKKTRDDLKINTEGNVFTESAAGCGCQNAYDVTSEETCNNKKKCKLRFPVSKDFKAHVEFPWSAEYSVDGSSVEKRKVGVGCD